MADDTAQTAETTDQATPPPAGGGLATYLKAAIVVGVIVVIECVAAYFLLPSSEKATAMAELAVQNDPPQLTDLEPAEEEEEEVSTVEIDLDAFNVSSYQPATNTTLRIDLHIYAVVDQENEAEFLTLFEKHRHRIREQILVIIRSAELGDLTDAGLGLIKRRILDKVNKTLEKPLVERIIVSDFSFVEQ